MKASDIYTKPNSLRNYLQNKSVLGNFPLHRFWGGCTSIESSKWIANASVEVDNMYSPTLSLIYLPHLDYCLQKFGPHLTAVIDLISFPLSYNTTATTYYIYY